MAARLQISRWKLNPDPWGLNNYAVKEWGGFIGGPIKSQWEEVFALSRSGKSTAIKFGYNYKKEWMARWCQELTPIPTALKEDPILISQRLWDKYGEGMNNLIGTPQKVTSKGIAVGKVRLDGSSTLKRVTDGKEYKIYYSKLGGDIITIDFDKELSLFGFQLLVGGINKKPFNYKIEISSDNKSWKIAVDAMSNITPILNGGYLHKFKIFNPEGLSAKSVRLVIPKQNRVIPIKEIKVFSEVDQF